MESLQDPGSSESVKALSEYLGLPDPGSPSTQTSLWSAGEALPGRLANELAATAGALWNHYGPTEAVIYGTTWRYTHALGDGPPPLGRPPPPMRHR